MTPEERIRLARSGATIQPPISAEDAEARYRAAGMDPVAARAVAQGEARIHGGGAQAIWGESPSAESLDRVRGVRSRQGAIDREARDAAAEPFVGRGLPVPGQAAPGASLPADRAVGTTRLLAQRDQQKAETSARMAEEAKSMGEWDKRQAAKQKDRNAQIAAMPKEEREAYADRIIGRDKYGEGVIPGNQNQFGISDRERTVDRDRVLTQAWQRYGKESGLKYEDFENAYDSALRATGSHGRATQALTKLIGPTKADMARKNFETGRQRAKDYNLARETGRSVKDVMFGNALRNAQTDREREDVMLEYGYPGHGNLAALSTKGRQEIAAVEAAGSGRGPTDPASRAMAGARSAGAGQIGQEIAAAQAHAISMTEGMGSDGAVARDQILSDTLLPRAAEIAQLPQHTPEQMALIRTWSRSAMSDAQPHLSPYKKFIHWAGKLGVGVNDPNAQRLFSVAMGLDPTPSWAERNWGTGLSASIPSSVVAAPAVTAADIPRGDL
jgi:hypothetical protein